jgi:hypothetical protein
MSDLASDLHRFFASSGFLLLLSAQYGVATVVSAACRDWPLAAYMASAAAVTLSVLWMASRMT